MAAGLCYGSDGGGCRLALHFQPGGYNIETLIGVLGELHRFLGGEKATLLWDGLPAHRSKAMQAFVVSQRRWLVVERLPAYAPELNPVEALWANLKGKGGELANFVGDTLDQVIVAATRGADRIRQTPPLPTRSCAAAACPCGEQHRTSALQRWQVDRAGRPARRSSIQASTSALAASGMSPWPACW